MLAFYHLKQMQHCNRTFRMTTIVKSTNSFITHTTHDIIRWTTADKRLRCSALALFDFEESCTWVHNFSRLSMVRNINAYHSEQRLNQTIIRPQPFDVQHTDDYSPDNRWTSPKSRMCTYCFYFPFKVSPNE
jgi:hypothetical protein